MKANEIRTAINWIETNVEGAPESLVSTLINAKEKLQRTLDRVAAREELEEQKIALQMTVEESRKAMKDLELKIKAQKAVEKAKRDEDRAAKIEAESVKKAEVEQRRAERVAKKAEKDALEAAKKSAKGKKVAA